MTEHRSEAQGSDPGEAASEADSAAAAGGGGAPSKPAAAASGEQSGRSASSSPRRGGRGVWVLASLALLLALAAGAGTAYLWRQATEQTERMVELDGRWQQRVERLRSELQASAGKLDTLGQQQSRLVARQQELQQAIERLRALSGRDHDQWRRAEVEYLLQVANRRLQLERDVASARQALQAADARLRELADPALLGVREQIADEISLLDTVPRPDLEGLALRLDGLSARVADLPVRGARPRVARDQARAEPSRPQPPQAPASGDWREIAAGIWDQLRSLVVIRRHAEPLTPLLGPEQVQLSRELLLLKLQSARTALLRQDPALYRTRLDEAAAWLRQRFDVQAAATAAVLDGLQRLRQTEIRPQLPDISGSLKRLRAQAAEEKG